LGLNEELFGTRWGTHEELDGNTMRISWEHIENNKNNPTPPISQ
jgi:hypothetical protein